VAGASPEANRHHYDLPDSFYRLWLGDDLVYSCALWDDGEGPEALPRAQRRKLDFFARRLDVPGARVLDVGCGWGALLDRFVAVHGARGGVGITPSPAQARSASQRATAGVEVRCEGWADHEPGTPYDAITCVEASEHFASDRLDADQKVEVYRAFFRRAASWLVPGGRLGLQVICLDDAVGRRSRPGSGPVTDLILRDIFRDSMSPSLSEMVLGWETHFELDELRVDTADYRRTFRAWAVALRAAQQEAVAAVGGETTATFGRYLAAGEAIFRLHEQALVRAVLTRRPEPKRWAVVTKPSDLANASPAPAATAGAVRSHYDMSNPFYRLWLGPSMSYSSAMWSPGQAAAELDTAQRRKVDFFAGHVLRRADPHRVLDVGCGWGGAMRRLLDRHPVTEAVGLTLSRQQHDYLTEHPAPGRTVLLEDWQHHRPDAPYDAVISFGAFEHFASDGSTGPQRIAAYRRFFAACHEWLVPGGRLGLETIAHDNAPDTATPLGRGPLADHVLELFPESLCPHLQEILLGLEPWFSVEVLRSDADDFARTFRAWHLALRSRQAEAAALVGEDTVRQFGRYLAACELQFRTKAITNYRLVLGRRRHRQN
jgi:cyclopropane-fatty-acyl-phospholipid synthase